MAVELTKSLANSRKASQQSIPQGEADPVASYRQVRHTTEKLCAPLETEDYVVQSMPDASPVKWHLAHTTWFFETFVLSPNLPDYQPFREEYQYLFNSYYETVGTRWPRPQRGILSRPTVAEVFQFRSHVDGQMIRLLRSADARARAKIADTVVLGLNHEQQHQELIITDLKHALCLNSLGPVYRERSPESGTPPALEWLSFPESIAAIGHDGTGFAFDNEAPRHKVFLNGFQIANRLVTNAEYLDFMADGGYDRADLWLSEGWAARQEQGWNAPLYWQQQGGEWFVATLAGPQPLPLAEPVCHVSYFEADAFARWAGARLPTEAEWETAASDSKLAGHFQESGRFHPAAMPAADDQGPLYQLYGDVWQWTASPYTPYPGYQPLAGALGEYNGKFMCNQFVLRGASCATPRSHARLTYRNFFHPHARWQFAGVRLGKDLS